MKIRLKVAIFEWPIPAADSVEVRKTSENDKITTYFLSGILSNYGGTCCS